MGCGKAGFGRKGQKTPKIENLGPKVCPWDFEATCTWDLEVTRDETSRQPARSLKSVLVLLAQILGPLGPPEVQPHPITIQNMRFGRLNFFWDRIPLSLIQASLMSDVTALDKIFNVAVWHWHSYLIKFGDMRLERMNNFAQIGHVAKLEVFRKFIPFGSLTSP